MGRQTHEDNMDEDWNWENRENVERKKKLKSCRLLRLEKCKGTQIGEKLSGKMSLGRGTHFQIFPLSDNIVYFL
jgi:hypothetical protein